MVPSHQSGRFGFDWKDLQLKETVGGDRLERGRGT
jgi:hypothetical protein